MVMGVHTCTSVTSSMGYEYECIHQKEEDKREETRGGRQEGGYIIVPGDK